MTEKKQVSRGKWEATLRNIRALKKRTSNLERVVKFWANEFYKLKKKIK